MRVRFILGEDADKPGQNEPHPVFSEMEEFKTDDGTDGEWKEVARYFFSFHQVNKLRLSVHQ